MARKSPYMIAVNIVFAKGFKIEADTAHADQFAFILSRGAGGGALDASLADGLAKIKASGKYQEIVGPYSAVASKYVEWQP